METYTKITIEVLPADGEKRKFTSKTIRWDLDLREIHEMWVDTLRGAGFMGVNGFYEDIK